MITVSKDALIHCPNCGTVRLSDIVVDAKKVGRRWRWDGQSWKCKNCHHNWKGPLLP